MFRTKLYAIGWRWVEKTRAKAGLKAFITLMRALIQGKRPSSVSPGTNWWNLSPKTGNLPRRITEQATHLCTNPAVPTSCDMAHRFKNVNIAEVTIENHTQVLPESIVLQIADFLPPMGSFDDDCLRRYLENLKNYEEEDANSGMTLANRLRLAFQDMQPDTICGKFPQAELPLKRRLRCVAEYLIRSGEFDKVRDAEGKLVKRRGVLGKMVVLYQPMPKLLESLHRQGLLEK